MSRVGFNAMLVVALVALITVPWVRALANCPPAASGSCRTSAIQGDCPCNPDGGYKSCTGLGENVCNTRTEHEVFAANWTCASNQNSNDKCVEGFLGDCWKLYKCKWDNVDNKCIRDTDSGVQDNASYVRKRTMSCAS